MMFDECSVEILRRCARAAGLIDRQEPLGPSLESFGLMVVLECMELAEQAVCAGQSEHAGQRIRSAFFGQSCGNDAPCPRGVPLSPDVEDGPPPRQTGG